MQAAYSAGVAVLSGTLILSACGGGGGGGTIPSPTPVETTPFTTWRTDVAGKVIEAKGFGRDINYTYSCANESDCKNTGQVTGISPATSTNVTALFFFDSNGNLTQLWPASTIGFSGTQIAQLNSDFVSGRSAVAHAIVSNPKSTAWDYQSFGVWESGLDSLTAGTYSVMSVGAPTTNVPTTGTATFLGDVVGAYVNSGGKGYAVMADLTVQANFTTQTLALSTTNTRISSDWSAFHAPTVNLELSGTLQYAAGTNSFTGELTTGNLTGTSTGTFYGPGAVELGGVFSLRPSDLTSVETYSGAYGAKQTTAP